MNKSIMAIIAAIASIALILNMDKFFDIATGNVVGFGLVIIFTVAVLTLISEAD